jgi:hypothetical protein
MAIIGSTDLGSGLKALTVDHDPTVVATDAPAGSIIIDANGVHWVKEDSGSTINVIKASGDKIDFTATEDDDVAFEIDVNAAGFADIKALDINYISGAIVAADDEEAILVNIDETGSTGGRIVALEVLATDEGAAEIDGLEVGVGINPLIQQSGTFGNADSLDNDGVDVTTALSSGGAGNISAFVADDDTFTIGDAAKYAEMEFILDTPASGSGIAPTFEYSTGVGTWAAFAPIDATNGFRNTGVVAWSVDDIPGWVVGTGSEFLIRITRTRNSLATTPIIDLVQIAATTEYSWDANGNITGNQFSGVFDLIPYQVRDAVGGQVITTAITVNLDTITIANASFYTLAADEIQFLVAGTYEISYIIAIEDTDTAGSARTTVEMWVEEDSAGFAAVADSYIMNYHRETEESSNSVSFFLTVAANDSIRLRAQRIGAATNIQTMANRTQITIKRVSS